jgi:hypothetical protein
MLPFINDDAHETFEIVVRLLYLLGVFSCLLPPTDSPLPL